MSKEPSLDQQLASLSSKIDASMQKKIDEENFAITANQRFADNLVCFEKYYPDVASAIKDFKTREDFCLHVTEHQSANFIANGESVPLYSDDPVAQCIEQVERNLSNPSISSVKYDYRKKNGKVDDRLHVRYMNKISELLGEIREDKAEKIQAIPERFPSAMIFGVGLGYHLPELIKRVEFDYIHIVEPDFELFFASLFCIEWQEIIEKIDNDRGCLFIHLGISYENFFDDLNKMVQDIGAFSISKTFCYQHYPHTNLNALIKDFFNCFYQFQNGFGFYNDAITSIAHTISHNQANLPFWISDKQVDIQYKDTPIFVVGNGPSLDKAEELLKAQQNNAIILAAGTALGSLLKMGIKPDFHVQIERPKRNFDILLDTLPKDTYKDLNLLTTNVIYSDTPSLYNWTGLAIKGNEAGSDYYAILRIAKKLPRREIIPFSNPLVANTALSFAASFGFNNIYLIGVDNAVSGDGDHHSKYSIYNDDTLTRKYKPLSGYTHKVAGNLGGDFFANNLYMVAKQQMEQLINYIKEPNYYNVGDGAKLKGAIPLSESDILIKPITTDKSKIVESIKASQFEVDDIEDESFKILDLDAFNLIASNIVEISREEFHSRAECLEILRRQARYVYSLRGGRYSYYYQLFKGSLLYYHCPIITLLYSYNDDDYTLNKVKEAMLLWNEYLSEVVIDFPKSFDKKCDWDLD